MKEKYKDKICLHHGLTSYVYRPANKRYSCRKCYSERAMATVTKIKDELIALKNGKCIKCGYAKCKAALEFYHLDPSIKLFTLAKSHLRSYSKLKILAEAEKCVLLCANCHREVETGITKL